MALRNFSALSEEVGVEMLADKSQRNCQVLDPARIRMPLRKWDLTVIVLRTVMEADRRDHLMGVAGMIERHHRIHPPAQKDYGLQNGISFAGEYVASTVTLTPPRGENSP